MNQHPVPDLVAYFAGTWSLQREIRDAAGEPVGSFTGTAEFDSEPGALVFCERGELRWGGHRGPASRALRYVLTGPGQAEVHFDYGDFFHLLDLRTGWCEAGHPCRDDFYRGTYRVLGPDRFEQCWQVSGPTKNHELRTVYDRS